jgi:hypothetical protein
MKLEQGVVFRLISFAIALIITLAFSIAACQAQGADHYYVTQSCHFGKCHKVKRGSMAITPDSIFITLDGHLRCFKILKKSRFNNYDLYEFDSYTFIKVFSTYASIIKWQDNEILTIIKA